MRGLSVFLLALSCTYGQDTLKRAENLYHRTDYRASIAALQGTSLDAGAYNLMGRDYFMLGEYKKATDAFQKATALEPKKSDHVHWLGRTFGRRAETSNPF